MNTGNIIMLLSKFKQNPIVIYLIAILLVFGAFLFKAMFEMNENPDGKDIASWRTDKAAVEKSIVLINPFMECIWTGGEMYEFSARSVPGPQDYFLKGYVLLDDSKTQSLMNEYEWVSATPEAIQFERPDWASFADDFLDQTDYLISKDFNRAHSMNGSFDRVVNFILGPECNTLYFDLTTK